MDGRFGVEGRRVTVVGAARSGIAAAGLLVQRGARVTLSDERTGIPGLDALAASGVELELGGHRRQTFTDADLLVVSPGVRPDHELLADARELGVPVIGELELASRWLAGRVVAITGTKGKSTTTTLTGEMLQRSGVRAIVGGNIGAPLSGQVADSTSDTVHVVEVSSFQLFRTDTFHPWIAAVLNVSADHLDWHPSADHYRASKARVVANQGPEDWTVVNADDRGAAEVAAGSRARRRWFGLGHVDEGVTVAADHIVERQQGQERPLIPVSAVRVPGRHILSDVLAAAAISRLAGATVPGIADAVARFTGLAHAMEAAGEIDGVRFVNDSKATNVEAARHAIESVSSGLVLIMGGRYKGGDFKELRTAVAGRTTALVLIGEASDLIEDALGDVVAVRRAASMEEAVRLAFAAAGPGGTVVLAPGCSSFDMFADYRERGERFRAAVRELAAGRRPAR